MTKLGKVYGFFECNAQKTEVEAELKSIFKHNLTELDRSLLEVSVIQGVENLINMPYPNLHKLIPLANLNDYTSTNLSRS